MTKFWLLLFASLCTLAPAVKAEVVAGDSLGVGAGMASGVASVAKVSASITNGVAQRQLGRLSSGTLVYLFLGTNNVASNTAPSGAVRSILNVARRQGLRLVWVGPPCMTSRRLAHFVPQFDASLGAIVRGSGFRYVSLYRAEHCRLERSSDGVHFTMSGYRSVWNMIQ